MAQKSESSRQSALMTPEPASSLLIDQITQASTPLTEADEGYSQTRRGVQALLSAMLAPTAGTPTRTVNKQAVWDVVADIDRKLTAQIDEILHHPGFQKIESAWRGLKFVVDRANFRKNIQVGLLNCSRETLEDDLNTASEIPKSGLYKKVYSKEYGVHGGKPYGAIIGNFEFSGASHDVDLLQSVAAVANMAHAPFIAAVSPRLFGEQSFLPMSNWLDVRLEGPAYVKWNSFRASDDARSVGLTLPRFLLRSPYHETNNPVRSFKYTERADSHESYLWGNASFAFASLLADSFAKTGWCSNIVGPKSGGTVSRLPVHLFSSMGGVTQKIPTEMLIPERLGSQFSDAGFMPLEFRKESDNACFFEANSCQASKTFGQDPAQRRAEYNHKLGTKLPYIFIVSRLAHYLKVLQREHIGEWTDRTALQTGLQDWLKQYISDSDVVQPSVAARRPLRAAKVTVEDVAGNPGWYHVSLKVTPHIQLVGLNIEISLVGKLETDTK